MGNRCRCIKRTAHEPTEKADREAPLLSSSHQSMHSCREEGAALTWMPYPAASPMASLPFTGVLAIIPAAVRHAAVVALAGYMELSWGWHVQE